MNEEREMQLIREELVKMMASMIGPTNDLMRSQINAKVDGLIAARVAFLQAGWNEWEMVPVLIALAGGAGFTVKK